jgi:hypothetical protein
MTTDWGAHHFDIAQWGMGMDESGPAEILAPPTPEAKYGVRYRYANGVEVEHKDGNGIWFFGKEGKVYVNRGKFEFWIGDQQKAKATSECDAVAKEYLADAKVRLYRSDDHRADWFACLRNRKRPLCDVEVGARTVSVCHLVNLAYYHGQRMQWDPKTEHFTGGTGDKAWLDVPHRDPWQLS